MLFSVEFREITEGSAELKATADIPLTARARPRGAHVYFQADYDPAIPIPEVPFVTLKFMGKIQAEFSTNLRAEPGAAETKWVQLNTARDAFTVQLRLEGRSVRSLVVHANGRAGAVGGPDMATIINI
jgi:hypothetical protein